MAALLALFLALAPQLAPGSELDGFPRGTIAGHLDVRDTPSEPTAARIRYEKVGSARCQGPECEGEVECAVEKRVFTCSLPVGVFDLRLQLAEASPSFYWQVGVPSEGTVDLGEVPVRPGGAITGWSAVSEVSLVLRPAVVQEPRARSEKDRLRARSIRTSVDESGRFAISAIPAGIYDLFVEPQTGSEWASKKLAGIAVEEGEELALGPIRLDPTLGVTVFLNPPIDPYGQPWRVRLSQAIRPRHYEQVPAPDVADDGGVWELTGLVPGPYVLEVGTELDPRWSHRNLELEPGGGDLLLDIGLDYVPLVGSVVTADGDPVRGVTLWFGGRYGPEAIRMDADADGVFRGYVPHEGRWPLEIARSGIEGTMILEPIDLESPPGGEDVELEIELPDTRVAGRVLNEQGHPVTGAVVQVVNAERRRREVQIVTDDEGRFEVVGVRPGPLLVQASHQESQSDWHSVQAVDGMTSADLSVILHTPHRLSGMVAGPTGPMMGAVLFAMPRSGTILPGRMVRQVTDSRGSFQLPLPAGTTTFDLIVLAPGSAARVFPVTLDPSGETPLDVVVEPAASGGVLTLDLGDRPMSQVILGHRGAKVSLLPLMEWGRPSDSDGRFVLPAMEWGDYQVCTGSPAGEGLNCSTGQLPSAGTLELRLAETTDEAESQMDKALTRRSQ